MKKLLTFSMIALSSLFANAQTECDVNYSVYKEFLNVESYKNALPKYREVFNSCPQYNKVVYIDGIKIYKGMISQTQNVAEINAYVDTLKMIYSKRIENYGEASSVLARCGLDVMKLRKSDTAYVEAYHILAQSVAADPANPDMSGVSAYFQLAVNLVAKNKISNDEFFAAIVPTSIAVKKNVATNDAKYKQQAEKIFFTLSTNMSKLPAQQSDFDRLFDEKYKVSNDIAEAAVMSETMSMLGCEGSGLFAQTAEKLYSSNPSSAAAASIARYNRKIKDYEKAAQYYGEAIERESDNVKKSVYLYEASTVANFRKKYSEAVSLAKKSAQANPSNGAPYLFIGAIYGSNANLCSTDAFVRREIYWIAADYVIKAKNTDPSLEADANSLLKKFSALFPNKEDAFMHSVKPGDVVRINAFDSEVTTARF